MKPLQPIRSPRRIYLRWVEDQIEAFKENVPRSELLALADMVIEELRCHPNGQYQITELLLCEAVDRRIFRMLKLPSYRTWCATYRSPSEAVVDPPAMLPEGPEPGSDSPGSGPVAPVPAAVAVSV